MPARPTPRRAHPPTPPRAPSPAASDSPSPEPAASSSSRSKLGALVRGRCATSPGCPGRTRSALRAGLVMTLSMAVLTGVAAEPARAMTAPGAPAALPAQQDPLPGAPGQKPGLASILVPGTLINRTVVGGPSGGAWNSSSSQGLPTDQPVDPSRQAKKPGLGTQDFYPLERRALGDRLETLVNLANGNLVVRATDMVFAGTGLNFGVSHFYNNQADNRGSFGKKWTMSTGRDVGLDVSDPGKVVLQGPSGYRQDYTRSGDSFTSPSGANAKMTKTGGGYELKFDKTKEKWNFDNNGFFTSQVDRNDNTINFNYNGDGTLASVKDTRQAVTKFDYDQAGRTTKITDPTGYEYGGYTYDLQGRHTGFTTPDGKRVEFGYDDAGNMTRIVDPNGNEYRFEYDDQRRVTKVDEPRETGVLTNDRAVTTYQYVSDTETKGTAPNGGTTTYTFDDKGRQEKAKDPLGREESKTFTANSDVNTTTSVGGNVSTASYDPANRLIGTKMPTGAQNAIGYSDGANPFAPTSATDSEGRQTTMTYDGEGNPLTVKNVATGEGTERTYNDNGTVKDSTDGKGNKTTYTYDADGRLTRVTYPGPRRPVSYEYDARSRLTAVTDGNGVTLEYAYDAADRVVQLSQRSGATKRVVQRTDFDANGNKTSNYHGNLTKRFTYSPRNQVLTDARLGALLTPSETVAYTYDATNNVASLRDGGGTTRYRYNQANDLTELTDLAGGVTTYGYDDDGNRNLRRLPSGYGDVWQYDDSGRVTRWSNYTRANPVATTTYDYRGASGGDSEQLHRINDSNNTTVRYTYDGSSRLTRFQTTANSNGSTLFDDRFTYDRASNITNLDGLAMGRNASNQMTTVGSDTINHDNQGNISGDSSGNRIGYSATNQQTSKTAASSSSFGYTAEYDTSDSTQLYSIKDRINATGATSSFEYTQTALGMTGRTQQGVGRISMSREPDGTPLMQRQPDGFLRYLSLDHQGSLQGVIGQDGGRYATYRYKPYGAFSNGAGSQSGTETQLIGFQGGFFHRTDRDYKFGHRWNISTLGGWTQPDPIGTPGSSGSGQDNRSGIGGPYSTELNAYNFANDNPANNSDPSGLLPACSGLPPVGDLVHRAVFTYGVAGGTVGGFVGGVVASPLGVTAGAGAGVGAAAGAIQGAKRYLQVQAVRGVANCADDIGAAAGRAIRGG